MDSVHDDGIDPIIKQLIRSKARRLSRRRSFACFDSEDIEQELVIHLLKARTTFQTGRDWHRFAFTVVRNAVAKLVRDSQAQKRSRHRTVSLDAVADEDPTEIRNLVRQQEHEHRRQQSLIAMVLDIQDVTAKLAEPEVELVRLLKSETISEIAKSAGTSRAAVYQKISRLRGAFEKVNLRDYLH